MDEIKALRKGFNCGITQDFKFREEQLLNIFKLVEENEEALCEAGKQDINKCKLEVMSTEIHMIKQDITVILASLQQLMGPQKVARNFATITDTAYIQRQPFGVVLIIGAWNYPLLLSLQPLVGAIAAGNCVLLKPSEISAHTEKVLAKLLPKYLDQRCCRVFCGGPKETQTLLQEKFDYIFYTGSGAVGRLILEAAAKHLTPTTLELGSKCPAYVDKSSDIPTVAKRLIWGKFLNGGQTCIAPDYVLCHESVKEELVESLINTVKVFYGEDASKSPDLCRIVNSKHFERIRNLLKNSKGKVVQGGDCKTEERYIAPTLVSDVCPDDSLMSEEIFGPVLPIVTVPDAEAAVTFIREREKPLAVYVFSGQKEVSDMIERRTTSGAYVWNDVIFQAAVPGLPFGGVGASGMGSYHGVFTFETFSHKRSCLLKTTPEMLNNLFRYPPYDESKLSWINWVFKTNPQGWSCNLL